MFRAHRTGFTAIGALAVMLGCAASAAVPAPPLSFIEDDYAAALAEARARGAPLFIESWAPW